MAAFSVQLYRSTFPLVCGEYVVANILEDENLRAVLNELCSNTFFTINN